MSYNLKHYLRVPLTSMLVFAVGLAWGQPIADIALIGEYMPAHFPAYNATPTTGTDANGEFVVSLFKTGADIPAGGFSVIVTLSPSVPVTDQPIAVPSGFELNKINNHQYQILQTAPYLQSGIPTLREIKFPVQAIAPIATGTAVNWSVEIQQDDFTYQDNQVDNNSAQGRVTVAENSLPVTLTTFKASEQEGEAYISWATTEEVGFDRFEVQRSLDGKSVSFTTVGKVSAKGVNGKGSSYSFTDRDAQKGQLLYYRLKMIDRDGTSEFSHIESLALSGVTVSVYPNPARNFVTVNATEPIRSLELINLAGQGMNKTRYSGDRKVETLQLGNTPSGVYQVKIEGISGNAAYKKIVVGE